MGHPWSDHRQPTPSFRATRHSFHGAGVGISLAWGGRELAGASISRGALSDVFLKKALRWGDGTPAQPVDQSARSAVREAFSQRVHGQPLAAVLRYWMRQIADGRGLPPPVKASDEEVIAYVASKRGAVGYVTAQAATPGTVRVLQVVD